MAPVINCDIHLGITKNIPQNISRLQQIELIKFEKFGRVFTKRTLRFQKSPILVEIS